MVQAGRTEREIVAAVGCVRSTVWKIKHQDLLDPELVDHASRTIANKLLLGATAAMDTYLDKATAGELNKEQPGRLIKMAATALDSYSTYAALSGAKDVLNNMLSDFGVQPSHSASRMTVEQKITVESASTQLTQAHEQAE
jgi:hypothetical protein